MGQTLKHYIARRLLMMIPTFLGISLISFTLIQLAPGGPLEQKIGQLAEQGLALNEELIQELKKQYGFDQPLPTRYWNWLTQVSTLNFGRSFSYEEPAWDVIKSKFPVSFQFGVGSLLLLYLISVPLGVIKALKKNSWVDRASSWLLAFFFSVPPLVLGLALLILFAGAKYLSWFPLGGANSDNYADLTLLGKLWDRVHHFTLPLICYVLTGFAELTVLTRNSFLDVLNQDFVRTARAKGVPELRVLVVHAFRNSLTPLVVGIGSFFRAFLAGSLIIETVFRLDGIGLLTYKSVLSRDYNVLMGLIFLSSIALMLGRLMSDIAAVWLDPRVDLEKNS